MFYYKTSYQNFHHHHNNYFAYTLLLYSHSPAHNQLPVTTSGGPTIPIISPPSRLQRKLRNEPATKPFWSTPSRGCNFTFALRTTPKPSRTNTPTRPACATNSLTLGRVWRLPSRLAPRLTASLMAIVRWTLLFDSPIERKAFAPFDAGSTRARSPLPLGAARGSSNGSGS